MEYLFTSESVSEGHPDKIADAISDGVLDTLLASKDPSTRCACEVMVAPNQVIVAGEYNGEIDDLDLDYVVRRVVKNVGYEQENFHWQTLKVANLLQPQSPDIALGTDKFGAGDQGTMFGYASNETEVFMPSALYWSHRIVEGLTVFRKSNGVDWLGPDAKSQVTMAYDSNGKPKHITKIVCSTQHHPDLPIEDLRKHVKVLIESLIPDTLLTPNTEFFINPTGRFVIGGPAADVGLTGRKIIVDTYGGYAPHGGGAFSGKDPTKVDRSAAYMARYLAKNIVAAGHADKATVQLSYAIGITHPMSVYVDCDTEDKSLTKWIQDNVDLTPKGIIDKFDLFSPIYSATTNYGHFGKNYLPWEKVDLFGDTANAKKTSEKRTKTTNQPS